MQYCTPVVEAWIELPKCPCKGRRVHACFKTVIQLGQGQNTVISQQNLNDQLQAGRYESLHS